MGNCLKSQLQAAVSNESLPKFGVLSVYCILPSNPANLLRVNCLDGKELTLKITSDNTITSVNAQCVKIDDKTGLIKRQATMSINGFIISDGTSGVNVDIYDCYGLTYIRELVNIDLKKIKYLINLSFIGILKGATGNTKVFENLPLLETILITNGGVGSNDLTGSIKDFGKNTALTMIKACALGQNYTKASIEEFVALQRANGRTSYTDMTFLFGNIEGKKLLTFNGADIPNLTATVINNPPKLSWTSNTITFDGTTISA